MHAFQHCQSSSPKQNSIACLLVSDKLHEVHGELWSRHVQRDGLGAVLLVDSGLQPAHILRRGGLFGGLLELGLRDGFELEVEVLSEAKCGLLVSSHVGQEGDVLGSEAQGVELGSLEVQGQLVSELGLSGGGGGSLVAVVRQEEAPQSFGVKLGSQLQIGFRLADRDEASEKPLDLSVERMREFLSCVPEAQPEELGGGVVDQVRGRLLAQGGQHALAEVEQGLRRGARGLQGGEGNRTGN